MHPAFPLSAALPTQDRPKTHQEAGSVLFTGPVERYHTTLGDLGITVPGASPETVVSLGRNPADALLTFKPAETLAAIEKV